MANQNPFDFTEPNQSSNVSVRKYPKNKPSNRFIWFVVLVGVITAVGIGLLIYHKGDISGPLKRLQKSGDIDKEYWLVFEERIKIHANLELGNQWGRVDGGAWLDDWKVRQDLNRISRSGLNLCDFHEKTLTSLRQRFLTIYGVNDRDHYESFVKRYPEAELIFSDITNSMRELGKKQHRQLETVLSNKSEEFARTLSEQSRQRIDFHGTDAQKEMVYDFRSEYIARQSVPWFVEGQEVAMNLDSVKRLRAKANK